MSVFLTKLRGVRYRYRVDRLRMAFDVACSPFISELKQIDKEVLEFEAAVARGDAQWSEFEEDGSGYDYGEAFGERKDDARESMQTLRKAFSILQYHTWERAAQRWGSNLPKRPKHADLVQASKLAGISLDESGLEQLNALVNVLKHNSQSFGPTLYQLRPDFFEKGFDPQAKHPVTGDPFSNLDWEDALRLEDSHIEKFFEVLVSSGPH